MERFNRSPCLQISSYIEDKNSDEQLGKTVEQDHSSPDLDEKDIISCTLNKEAEDEIDQLTAKFRSCLMKTIYGEAGASDDRNPHVEKGPNLMITTIVVHRSSISSDNYCHHSSCDREKSLILKRESSLSEWGKTDATKKIETPRDDVGRAKLPLPPRLREASYRNPLQMSSPHRDSIELQLPSPFVQFFSPQESLGRNNVQSTLSKIAKKHKEISVKLWRNTLNLVRQCGKLELSTHPCWPPAAQGDPDCRSSRLAQHLQLKLRSKWVKFMQSQQTFCVSRRISAER